MYVVLQIQICLITTELWSPQRKSLGLSLCSCRLPPTLTPGSHWYFLHHHHVVILRMLYKWNHTICKPLRSDFSFIYIRPIKYIQVLSYISSSFLLIVSRICNHCMAMPYFVYSPLEDIHVISGLGLYNKAAMNIGFRTANFLSNSSSF